MFEYEELNKEFMGGKWEEGRSGNVLEKKNGYSEKRF
ncbi:hypothetical protein, partial [Bacillus subtilis]